MRPIGDMLLLVLICLVLAGLVLGVFGFRAFGRKAAAATLQTGSLLVDGAERTYSVAVPGNFSTRKRYPIVMLLHGGMGSGTVAAEQTGLVSYVDRDQFIAVFPDAGDRQWNDGRSTTGAGANDVAFLLALVRHIADRHGGDPQRAFLAGASNGGMMAQRVACEASGAFRAYAAVVANLPEELMGRCRPSRPVPILFILGKADPAMPWAGGEVLHGRRMGAGGRVISGPDTVNFFARANGCVWERVTELPDRADDGTSVRLHTFRCSGGPVVLYEIEGGGHGWPGGHGERGPLRRQMMGNVSQEIDATQIMLDFFRKNGL